MPEARKTILLVEDEELVAECQARCLGASGFAVLHATDGNEALALLDGPEAIDIVLMDIDLGQGMDGTETARRILGTHDLPLVFLSSHVDPETVRKTEGIDCYGYVTKDSGTAVLVASIHMAFRLFDSLQRERAAEAELKQREGLLSMAIESSGAGLWDWHLDTGDMVINDRWAAILGYRPDELLPITIETFARLIHPDDLLRSNRITEDYLSGRIRSHAIEIRMRHKDGHWVWLLDRGMLTEQDRNGSPLRMTGMHIDISDRVRAEEAMGQMLAQKEVFISELHHRVKNNLTLVSSLLELQMPALADEGDRAVFESAVLRIKSIALLHEKLMDRGELDSVRLGAYLKDLAESVFDALSTPATKLHLITELDDFDIAAVKAIPVGIIVNELLTNSLKYGFPGERAGRISIGLEAGRDEVILRISDSGVGLPPGFDLATSEGLGLSLVRLLAGQLHGSIATGPGPGTSYTLRFPR